MLDSLQRQLTDYYQVGTGHDIKDYLITDRALAVAVGQGCVLDGTEESLLMAEECDGLALSLYLDKGLLERLGDAAPLENLDASQLSDFWTVVEGISHFNCVVWKASQGHAVSLLELELQAEIDKYISTMQLAVDQGSDDIARGLHSWLFDDVRFRAELDGEQRDRYRWANDSAARYCHGLGRHVADAESRAIGELRAFFRLPMAEKVSRIHALAWGAAER